MSGPGRFSAGSDKRAMATVKAMPTTDNGPSQPAPMFETWIGYVMVPAKGGSTNGWFVREVELPAEVVAQYMRPGKRCPVDDGPNQRNVQIAKVREFLADPELLRAWGPK